MSFNSIKVAFAAAALLAAGSAGAVTFTIDFNALSPAAAANGDGVAVSHGISFASAYLTADLDTDGSEILDAFGNFVPGFTHYAAYDDSDIRVGSPAASGYGTLTSPAIDARFDQLLLRFSQPVSLASFSFTADGSSFGSPQAQRLLFLDAAGKTVQASVPFLQAGLTGFAYDLSPSLAVSAVLMGSGKFYDNLSITTAVPEPQTWLMLVAGLACLGGAARRRR